jgi:hypothetical protein
MSSIFTLMVFFLAMIAYSQQAAAIGQGVDSEEEYGDFMTAPSPSSVPAQQPQLTSTVDHQVTIDNELFVNVLIILLIYLIKILN